MRNFLSAGRNLAEFFGQFGNEVRGVEIDIRLIDLLEKSERAIGMLHERMHYDDYTPPQR
jgi:hypothetical protein